MKLAQQTVCLTECGLAVSEKIRGGSRVQNLVQGFGGDGVTRSREDLRLPPTPPPHNHRSPDNTDTDEHK